MVTAARCAPTEISTKEARQSALTMLGVSFLLASTGVVLSKTFGPNLAIDALLNSAFFIALTIASRTTYLKPYSPAARNAITAAISLAWFAFFFGVSLLGSKI